MDILSTKTPRVMTLIKVLFGIIASMVAVILLLVFTLKINQTVQSNRGEIIAENVPMEYLAPAEAVVEEILVKPGDKVSKGDTLLLLSSEMMRARYQKSQEDLTLTIKNIALNKKLLKQLNSKIKYQQRDAGNIRSDFKHEKTTTNLELDNLRKQVISMKRKLDITEGRLRKDLKLLEEGLISEADYMARHKNFLDESNLYTDMYKRYEQQKVVKNNLKSTQSQKYNRQKLDVLASQYEQTTLQKAIQQENINKIALEREVKAAAADFQKLTVISDIEGYVSKIFGTKQQANFVAKGLPLVVVSPQENQSFYAKLSVAQEDVPELKTGQLANIRLDAYHYYKYGMIQGEIIHIDRDTSNVFYALAEIPEQETKIELKNGFEVKGDIIVEEVRLNQFIFRNMFKN